MRTHAFAAAMVAGLLMVAGAWAQEREGQERRDGRTRFADLQKFLKEHDKNNDGYLTKDELPPDCRDFDQIDRNKDNKLSRDELQAHARQMRRLRPVTLAYIWVFNAQRDPLSDEELQHAYAALRKMDTNSDGKIGRDEIAAAKRELADKMVASRLHEMDTDRDGKLSKDEVSGWIAQRFQRIDQNGDGQLTREELVAACTGQETVFTSERTETDSENP